MVKVLINKNNEYTKEITIKGHANSNINENDFDLVCAGVSAVVYGILNSLDENMINIKISDGFVNIKIKEFSKENDLIMNVLEKSLRTIEEGHKKYVSIREEIL